MNQACRSGGNQYYCLPESSSCWPLTKKCLLTSKNIKRCLPVVAVVSIEDVADNHAGFAHSSISNKHAAHFLLQSDCFIKSLTGLFHLSSCSYSIIQTVWKSVHERSITVKDVFSSQEPVSPNKGRRTPRFERTKAPNRMSDADCFLLMQIYIVTPTNTAEVSWFDLKKYSRMIPRQFRLKNINVLKCR